jgi:hypothetical protein
MNKAKARPHLRMEPFGQTSGFGVQTHKRKLGLVFATLVGAAGRTRFCSRFCV